MIGRYINTFIIIIISEEYDSLAAAKPERTGDQLEEVSTVSHRIQPGGASSLTRTTTTTTTTVAMPVGLPDDFIVSSASHEHPIIVLQEAPLVLQPPLPEPEPRPLRTLNPYNPRHQRMLRRHSTRDLQEASIFLTTHILNTLVVQGGDGSAAGSAATASVK